MTLKHDNRAAVGGSAISYIDALAVRPDELSTDDGDGIGNGDVSSRGGAGRQCASHEPEHSDQSL